MTLRLYNTLTKREEPFEAIDEAHKRVTFYSCGPTVYDFAHIGNFRSFLNADVLRRTLELLGYAVHHVMNITDVGHMTEDDLADGSGQDKMELAAQRLREDKKSGKLPSEATDIDPSDPYAIAEYYTQAFIEDARLLGLKVAHDAKEDPMVMPRATQYVPAMVEMIQKLLDKGNAYIARDGVVYFDVQSFPEYGKLSGNTPDRIRSGEGGRVDEATQAIKKHPADFMLWKPDPTHLMRWPSPWGEGYPGWHIECSVMAGTLLGEMIDLHSGGEDNIFPHHECEIAQSCCATGKPYFARYWFHTRFLIVEGQKMSKSMGNFFTVRDLLARGATPAAIRLELIKTHYRSNANFTFQGLQNAQRQIERWAKLQEWLRTYQDRPLPASLTQAGTEGGASDNAQGPLELALPAFKEALMADLNIAGAIGVLSEAANRHNINEIPPAGEGPRTYGDELAALEIMNSVLGVLDLQREAGADDDDLAKAVQAKIAQRNAARKAKDWAAADAVRDELLAMGVAIKDGPDGTTWTRVIQ